MTKATLGVEKTGQTQQIGRKREKRSLMIEASRLVEETIKSMQVSPPD